MGTHAAKIGAVLRVNTGSEHHSGEKINGMQSETVKNNGGPVTDTVIVYKTVFGFGFSTQ